MEIYYRKSEKRASEGDVKVMKDGKMFLRGAVYVRMHPGSGMAQVYYAGKPSFEWHSIENIDIDNHRHLRTDLELFLEKGFSIFESKSSDKKIRTRPILLDLATSKGRELYQKYLKKEAPKDSKTKMTIHVQLT